MKKYILLFFIILLILFQCKSNNDIKNKYTRINFNSSEWKNGDEVIRGNMVHDLIESKILLNKIKEDILYILGQPDDIVGGITFSYNVDRGAMFGSTKWFYFLRIYFNNNAEVETVELID